MSTVPNAPTPDPAEGSTANEEVSAARRDVETQLGDGSLSIDDLRQMSEAEATTGSHRVVGHMHIRAALLALPHIGETRADEILDEVGVDGSRHIDDLGTHQVAEIAAAVRARQPG